MAMQPNAIERTDTPTASKTDGRQPMATPAPAPERRPDDMATPNRKARQQGAAAQQAGPAGEGAALTIKPADKGRQAPQGGREAPEAGGGDGSRPGRDGAALSLRPAGEKSATAGGKQTEFIATEKKNGDVEYRYKEGGKLAFTDHGDRKEITVHARRQSAVEGAMDLAKEKGWNSVEVGGRAEFKDAAWQKAKARDMQVTNHEPTPAKQRSMEARQESERQARERAPAKGKKAEIEVGG